MRTRDSPVTSGVHARVRARSALHIDLLVVDGILGTDSAGLGERREDVALDRLVVVRLAAVSKVERLERSESATAREASSTDSAVYTLYALGSSHAAHHTHICIP